MKDRLSSEDEHALARRIVEAETRARRAASRCREVSKVMNRRASASEKTRAGATGRLKSAVSAMERLAHKDPALAPLAREAREALEEADRLCWQLAMTGISIALGEARKALAKNRSVRSMLDFEDLAQEGMIGLLSAARRFNPDRGVRFSTYAHWWVYTSIGRAIDNSGKAIRIPAGASAETARIQKCIRAIKRQGRKPTVEELAEKSGLAKKRVALLLDHTQPMEYLDEPSADGLTVLEMLHDGGDAHDVEQMLVEDEQARAVRGLLEKIPERQRYVICERFGLTSGEGAKLSEVGEKMGVSRERVRQIEREALEVMRAAADTSR